MPLSTSKAIKQFGCGGALGQGALGSTSIFTKPSLISSVTEDITFGSCVVQKLFYFPETSHFENQSEKQDQEDHCISARSLCVLLHLDTNNNSLLLGRVKG